MARHTRRDAEIGLNAIGVEGGLISPEQLSEIAKRQPDQKAADDYGCPRGVSLRDEITRYFRIGQALWQDFSRLENPRATQTATFANKLLKDVFGFDDLQGPVVHRAEGHTYRIALEAREGRVPIVVAAPLADPKADAFNKALPEMGDDDGGSIARRSPATLLQSWLNANSEALWGLVFAGDRVRLMRDNASFTRAAHVEADLGAIFRDEMFADFTALWLLIHASRFGGTSAATTDCALERWREAGQKSGTAARERLRGNVEEALLELGQGLIDANPDLANRMASDGAVLTSVYEQMLRVVYRLIFLAVAEARDLLHVKGAALEARALYAGSYGFSHMRERAARRAAHDHHHDAWESARITFRALDRGERSLGLPGLGGLFAAGGTPDLDNTALSNRRFLTAVFRLSWLTEDGRRVRLNWRDMATEELGSVYEGLLELVPQVADGGKTFAFAGDDEARGNARKISGSYYTPDSLVQALLDSALTPVLEQAEREGGAEGVLKLNVIDPACGSGHFLLGAARRMATRVAQLRDADAPDYQAAMRDVVRLCIHGVDRNPMAVELAKVALWIEAIEPGKPLGFLDANILCGDSLLGVFNLKALEDGIPDAAYKPLTGDDKEAARIAARVNRHQREDRTQSDMIAGLAGVELGRAAERLHLMPEDTLADMTAKAQAFTKLRGGEGWGARKLACDLYVAAFLRKKQFRDGLARGNNPDRIPTTLDVRTALSGRQPDPQLTALAVDLADEARAFHWPLEFPDVFARGGFDLVIGNPPWERIKLQEKEFFARRDMAIAGAANKAARQKLIEALAEAAPGTPQRMLSEAFEQAKRTAEASSEFARVDGRLGGRFALTGTGDVNTYALFAELFANLAGPAGRAGIIVPTGVATDATTAPFFSSLIEDRRLVSLIDFENRERIFPGVYFRVKFCLLTLGRNSPAAQFSFFLTSTAQLQEAERQFSLTPGQISRINPNTKTAPVFRSRADARLTAKIYESVPVLIQEEAGNIRNAWGIRFMAMFHMSNESENFRTAHELLREGYLPHDRYFVRADSRFIPLFEAKMMFIYDHRYGDFALAKERDDADYREIPSPSEEMLSDPMFEVSPRYWVPFSTTVEKLRSKGWGHEWLLSFRDITNTTNERTVITALLPEGGTNHKTPLILTDESPKKIACLTANLASLVLDYIARQKVGGTSLTYFYVKQFPVLPPETYAEGDINFIVPRVLELTYTSRSMSSFAEDLGYAGDPFRWDEGRRAQLRAELDAWYARAYGLTRDELRYLLDPAEAMGPDYPSETFRVLKEKEIRRYGEYRTQRLVLAAWDAQEASQSQAIDIDYAALHDGAWAGLATLPLADAVQLQLAAILKALPGGTPESDVRLAALCAIEPRFLTGRLQGEQQRHWRRLVGAEAEPLPGAVVPLTQRVSPVWGAAVNQLRSGRALVANEQERTWSAGPEAHRYMTSGWPEARTRFILSILPELKRANAPSSLSETDQVWIRGDVAA